MSNEQRIKNVQKRIRDVHIDVHSDIPKRLIVRFGDDVVNIMEDVFSETILEDDEVPKSLTFEGVKYVSPQPEFDNSGFLGHWSFTQENGTKTLVIVMNDF